MVKSRISPISKAYIAQEQASSVQSRCAGGQSTMWLIKFKTESSLVLYDVQNRCAQGGIMSKINS